MRPLVTLVLVSRYFILHRQSKRTSSPHNLAMVSTCNRLHTAYHILQIISPQLVIIYNSLKRDSYGQLFDFLRTICRHF
jgi:hypothetical protein